MKDLVRHIAASAGPRVAIGAFEQHVEVWDMSMPSHVATFSTVLDFGGRRLCLDHEGGRCFAGAYHRYGVVGYDAIRGIPLWVRSDIKRVQYISYSALDGVFIGREGGSGLFIDADSGKTVEMLRGVRRVFEAPTGSIRLLDRRRPIVQCQGSRTFELARTTFAILDVAFGPATICVSEATGPTRCLALESGREVWRYDPKDAQVVALAYCASATIFVGISRGRNAEYTLLHLGPNDRTRTVAVLGQRAAVEFCLSGEAVLMDDGRLIESSTGGLLRNIPFVDDAG